jgi:hypothetical protein
VNLDWVKDIRDPVEKENFKKFLLGNEKLLDKLSKIVHNYIRESEYKTTDYDSASWAYKQAHANGEKAAFEKILKLLDLGGEKER